MLINWLNDQSLIICIACNITFYCILFKKYFEINKTIESLKDQTLKLENDFKINLTVLRKNFRSHSNEINVLKYIINHKNWVYKSSGFFNNWHASDNELSCLNLYSLNDNIQILNSKGYVLKYTDENVTIWVKD